MARTRSRRPRCLPMTAGRSSLPTPAKVWSASSGRLREYAEGCNSSPVGFVEGWYVDPEARRSGVGRRLVEAAEDWAREAGCTEMASDSLIDNDEGHRAHEAIGFTEVERLVCFRKSLP